MSGEVERRVCVLESRTRHTETWWVVSEQGGVPHSFGSDEKTCREYQQKHGGELQITRLWETTHGEVVALEPGDVTGEHVPECNDRCKGDSHYFPAEAER